MKKKNFTKHENDIHFFNVLKGGNRKKLETIQSHEKTT